MEVPGSVWGVGGVAGRGALAHPSPRRVSAVDHVVPDPESSLVEALERWREWADGKACCDYALHVDIPRWSDRVRQELHTMVQEKGLLPAAPCALSPRRGVVPAEAGQGVTLLSSVLSLSSACWHPARREGSCALWVGWGGRQLRAGGAPSSPLSPLPPGVNSFMVYMAYKDLYQMSNTEVRPPSPPGCVGARGSQGDGGHAGCREASVAGGPTAPGCSLRLLSSPLAAFRGLWARHACRGPARLPCCRRRQRSGLDITKSIRR